MSIYVAGYYVLLLLVSGSALKWGGCPERVATLALLLAIVATIAVRHPTATRYAKPEFGVLLVDAALLTCFVWIAIKTDREWIIWAAAMCATSMLAHVARITNPSFWRFAYSILANAAGYPILIALAYGVVGHARRRRVAAMSLTAR